MGQVGVVAEQVGHQGRQHARDLARAPGARRLARETEAGERRRDHVESVGHVAAEILRMGEGPDEVQELGDGARPTVGDDERNRVRPAALLVDEMDFDAVDRRGEVVEAVDHGLVLAPIVLLHPVSAEFLHVVEVGAVLPATVLRHLMPGKVGDAPADEVEGSVGDLQREGADVGHGAVACRSNKAAPIENARTMVKAMRRITASDVIAVENQIIPSECLISVCGLCRDVPSAKNNFRCWG